MKVPLLPPGMLFLYGLQSAGKPSGDGAHRSRSAPGILESYAIKVPTGCSAVITGDAIIKPAVQEEFSGQLDCIDVDFDKKGSRPMEDHDGEKTSGLTLPWSLMALYILVPGLTLQFLAAKLKFVVTTRSRLRLILPGW